METHKGKEREREGGRRERKAWRVGRRGVRKGRRERNNPGGDGGVEEGRRRETSLLYPSSKSSHLVVISIKFG